MEAFRTHTGLAVGVDRANIDTDQLIPKQFCKSTSREGYGRHLLHNWRFHADGTPNSDFVMNEPRYQGASILITSRNFGSGSSREHAVWALWDYGFRSILAPSFSDILYNNCFKNGLLPVVLPEPLIEELLTRCAATPGYRLSVDLLNCAVRDDHGFEEAFAVDPFRRQCLLEGWDDIALTLRHLHKIEAYEALHRR